MALTSEWAWTLTRLIAMKHLPATANPLVLRTDFSNQGAWDTICATIQAPTQTPWGEVFHAYVHFLDNVEYAAISKEQVLELIPEGYEHTFIVIADEAASSPPDYPLLVVDLYEERGREFRAPPSQIQSVENNLSIANMGFEEFAEAVDSRGIFRGF